MRCLEKGCAFPAVTGKEYCKAHIKDPLPMAAPPPGNGGEFEIVDLAVVPQFKILNEKSYSIARTVAVLGPGKALRVRAQDAKRVAAFIASIVNYCAKMGIKIHHRKVPGFVYFWKDGQPQAKK